MISGRTRTSAVRSALLAKIHIAKKKLKLDDDSYRDLLERVTGKRSAANCSDRLLGDALDEFSRLGFGANARGRQRKSANVSDSMRPLVGKIRALWGALHNLGALSDGSDSALTSFVKRQARMDATEFLDPHGANQVIEALKAWCAREGFDVPSRGLAAKRALLRAQWARLGRLGVLRIKIEDALHEYVSGIVSPHKTSVDLLDSGQLDRAADRLGKWIRYANARAAEEEGAGEDL